MSPASPLKDLAMADYVPALRNAAVVRMVKQLSDVYSSMRISELSKVRRLAGGRC
jgi:translation initiation factor 3 subunit A